MRALVLHSEHSFPEIAELDMPKPGRGQVLIKVSATGLNYADTMVRRGFYLQKPTFPHIPGLEFCGTVEQRGEGVDNVKLGERVMGLGEHTFAEYCLAPAAALMPVPEGYSDEEAAGFPVTHLTAWGMLRLSADAQPGETVLIHAAAGGVGTAATMLAKHLGLRVIGTASTAGKLEIARRTGADFAFFYDQPDFVKPVLDATGGRGADIILDSIGGMMIEQEVKCAAPFARIVVYGMAGGDRSEADIGMLFHHSVSVGAFWLYTLAMNPEIIGPLAKELLEVVAKTGIRPVIGAVYPFDQAMELFSRLEKRQTYGKLILKP